MGNKYKQNRKVIFKHNKMKLNKEIVHVVSYYPPHLGGMENCVQKISEILTKRKYKLRVYASSQGYNQKYKDLYKLQITRMRSIEIAHTPIIFSLPGALFRI